MLVVAGANPISGRGAISIIQEKGFLPVSIHRPERARFVCMKSSTKDKIKGSVNQVRGAIKEKAGKASGNPDLQDRGTAEKVGGAIQKKVGDVKKVFGK